MEESKVKVVCTREGRRHSDEFRAAVLAACEVPGARVSAVASRHGVNTNLVYKWLERARRSKAAPVSQTASSAAAAFIPIVVAQPVAEPEPVVVEFCRRDITVRVSLPTRDIEGISHLLRGVLL